MVTVYSPLGEILEPEVLSISPMPAISDGVTIAILDNSKHNFRALMDQVSAAVGAKYPNVRWHVERKPGAAHPLAEDVRERILKTANVVFTGSGD
jgi:hypothetical protein